VAACVRSVMLNGVSNTVIIEFSKRNESYRNIHHHRINNNTDVF